MNPAKVLAMLLLFWSASTGSAAFAADPVPTEPGAFIRTVHQAGLLNLEAARMALDRATSQCVKDFAQRMIYDEWRLLDKIADVARTRAAALSSQLDAERDTMLTALRQKRGNEFDDAYRAYVLADRTKLAELLQSNLLNPDAEVTVFASYNLPLVREHRRLAERLQDPANQAATGRCYLE